MFLPLTQDIIVNKETKLKMRSNKNNILGQIPDKEKDRALGFIMKQPSLITRQYTVFIKTPEEMKCPYCHKQVGNIILHQFKCSQLFQD